MLRVVVGPVREQVLPRFFRDGGRRLHPHCSVQVLLKALSSGVALLGQDPVLPPVRRPKARDGSRFPQTTMEADGNPEPTLHKRSLVASDTT